MKPISLVVAVASIAFFHQSALASAMLGLAWRDVSFTTEGGTHVEAARNRKGSITKLLVIKNGKTCLVPDSVLEKITDANIDNIQVFEEPGFDYVVIRIESSEFDEKTGNLIRNVVWSLRISGGKFDRLESQPE